MPRRCVRGLSALPANLPGRGRAPARDRCVLPVPVPPGGAYGGCVWDRRPRRGGVCLAAGTRVADRLGPVSCGWFVAALEKRLRASRYLAELERGFDGARLEHAPGRHWYVNLLGVRPQAQGKGLSRAVLGPIFAAADRDRVPVYLETVPETNVAIYRRLGFELVGHRQLAGGLMNWEMLRTPLQVVVGDSVN